MKLQLLLLFFLFSSSLCLWSDIVYTASLSISQVVPTPNDPPEYTSGNAVCTYVQNSKAPTLNCKVQHNIQVVTNIFIGVAPRNNLGTPIFNYTTGPFSYYADETFTFVNISNTNTNYTISEQVDDFLNGLWFIQILSDDYPDGILRGQLEHTTRGYSILSVANTVPRASGSTATGVALIDYSFYEPNRLLSADIVNSVSTPTGTEIRMGLAGQAGPLVYEFDTTASPQFDTVSLSVTEATEFLDNQYYLNVLSKINPSGEIRGQLTTVDYPNNVGFTSRLSGSSNNTNNLGCAIIGFDCITRVMEIFIMHDVPDANGVFVATTNGNSTIPIFSIPSYESPIYFNIKLTPQQEYYLFAQALFIAITSTQFPRGEIFGDITVKYDFFSYLSGSNIIPPITTSAAGCATFSLDSNNQLNYAIFHTVKSPLEVSINFGNEGQNGVATEVIPSTISPVRGTSKELSSQELRALVYEQVYISISSENYPYLGEIRGQIKRVDPCSESEDVGFSVVQTSLNNGDNPLGGGASSSSVPLLAFVSLLPVVLSLLLL